MARTGNAMQARGAWSGVIWRGTAMQARRVVASHGLVGYCRHGLFARGEFREGIAGNAKCGEEPQANTFISNT